MTASQMKEIMNVISYCDEYCLLSDTKMTRYLNRGVLLKNDLIDLLAHYFVHAKTSLCACYEHASHCVHNLSRPA